MWRTQTEASRMRALKYFRERGGREPAAELALRARSRCSTIAAGLFVLGFFLMVNSNLQRVVGRWSEAAEMSVYLKDEATRGAGAGARSGRSIRAASPTSVSTCPRPMRWRDSAKTSRTWRVRPSGSSAIRLPASLEVRLGADGANGGGDGRRPRRAPGVRARRRGCALRPALAQPSGLGRPLRPHRRARHRRAPRRSPRP